MVNKKYRKKIAAALLINNHNLIETIIHVRAASSKHRRWGIHPINRNRHSVSIYYKLVPRLRRFPDKFFQFCRLTPELFDWMVTVLDPYYERKRVNSKSLTIGERLMITLR